jgi:hypothetical protein
MSIHTQKWLKYLSSIRVTVFKYSNIRSQQLKDREYYHVIESNIHIFAKNYCDAINNGVTENINLEYNIKEEGPFKIDYLNEGIVNLCVVISKCDEIMRESIIDEMRDQIYNTLKIKMYKDNDLLTRLIYEEIRISSESIRIYWFDLGEKIFVQRFVLIYIINNIIEKNPGKITSANLFISEKIYKSKPLTSESIIRHNPLFGGNRYILRKRYNWMYENNLKETFDYDIKDPFYFESFLRYFNDKKRIFNNKESAVTQIKKYLGRIIRIINKEKKYIIVKISSESPFEIYKLKRFIKTHKKDIFCFYRDQDDKKKKFKVFNILIKNENRWYITDICYKPYNIQKEGEILLNLFTGFKSKEYINIEEEKIKNILIYIYEVWANSNKHKYHYILSWISNLVQLKYNKKRIPLIIYDDTDYSSELVTFISDEVLGERNCEILYSLSGFYEQFNKSLYDKVFVCIEGGISRHTVKKWNKVKDLLENKSITIKNNNELSTKNTIQCVYIVDNEIKDKNSLIAENTNIINKQELYEKFYVDISSTNKKDVGNCLFTYMKNYKCDNIEKFFNKKEIMEEEELKRLFIFDLLNINLNITDEVKYNLYNDARNHYFQGNDEILYITVKSLCILFTKWCADKQIDNNFKANSFSKLFLKIKSVKRRASETIEGVVVKGKEFKCISRQSIVLLQEDK